VRGFHGFKIGGWSAGDGVGQIWILILEYMARDSIGCGVAEEEWTDVSVGEGLEDVKLEI